MLGMRGEAGGTEGRRMEKEFYFFIDGTEQMQSARPEYTGWQGAGVKIRGGRFGIYAVKRKRRGGILTNKGVIQYNLLTKFMKTLQGKGTSKS